MTHHRQIVTNTVVNRQSLFSGSSSRGTNSLTNSYPWEMGNADHQGLGHGFVGHAMEQKLNHADLCLGEVG